MKRGFHGLLLAHFATHKAMQEATRHGGLDPDRMSFQSTVCVPRWRVTVYIPLPPHRDRRNVGGVERVFSS